MSKQPARTIEGKEKFTNSISFFGLEWKINSKLSKLISQRTELSSEVNYDFKLKESNP